jgi:hypothetical protein
MTIHLFNSLLTMINILQMTTDLNTIPFKNSNIFSNKFVVEHSNYNTIFSDNKVYHNLKCWKSNCLFSMYLENDNKDNQIFSLDFLIDKYDNYIKIENIIVNNDFYENKYKEYFTHKKVLKPDETKLIYKTLIKFVENYAIKERCNRIIIDIHNNLERYNEELKEFGFKPTNKTCLLNPFWIEAEKNDYEII